MLPPRIHHRAGPGRFFPDASVLIPLLVLFASSLSGPSLKEAIHASASLFISPLPGLILWGQVILLNAAIFLYLLPVFKARKACLCAQAPAAESADLAMKRLNRVHRAVIGLSILFFVGGRVLTVIANGSWVDTGAGEKGFSFAHMGAYVAESAINGFFVGVLLSLQFDNRLYSTRRCVVGLQPAVPMARVSLYAKVFLILVSTMLFMTEQAVSTFANFFELGMKGGLPGLQPFATPPQGPDFIVQSARVAGLGDAFKVFGLRLGILLGCAGLLLGQLKVLLKQPVGMVLERLSSLNSPDPGSSQSIEVVQEDEFAPIFREINSLIARQRGQIKLSSERLENVVADAADPIIAFDESLALRLFNPAAEKAFGYAAAEVLGKEAAVLFPGGRADLDKAMEEESPRMAWRRRDGGSVLMESRVSCSQRAEASGQAAWTVIILRDVGAQAELEETLMRAKAEAEEASRMKSEFLANMSHELRTPLNAILGFTQLLGDDRNLTEGQRERIGTISRSGEHLLALINDILDISKIEAGKMELHESVFDLHRFLKDMAEMFELKCHKKGLSLYMDTVDGLPRYVEGDLGKLRQVMVNLLGNAVKFTQEGGVSILAGRDGDGVRFAVRDTGRGIPADELGRIMQPFVQASTTDHEGGTGLGLAISRRYAAMMGGELAVESELGKGSSFSFRIPLRESSAAPEADEGAEAVIAVREGAEVSVLVVDDQVANRIVLKEMLERAGFSVMEAENGAQAVERAGEFRPAIVFMDIKMPVMDGYAAVAALKRNPATAGIKVFALTASAFTQDEERITRAGFDGFLAKPFRRSTLYALIRERGGVEPALEAARAGPVAASPLAAGDGDYAAAALALGHEGLERIAEAAQINDFASVKSLAESMAAAHPAFSSELRAAASSFDEAAIGAILRRLGRGEGKA